jgi:hypothetical protein
MSQNEEDSMAARQEGGARVQTASRARWRTPKTKALGMNELFGAAASRREAGYMIMFSFMMLMADAARVVDIRLRMMPFGESIPAELLLWCLRR